MVLYCNCCAAGSESDVLLFGPAGTMGRVCCEENLGRGQLAIDSASSDVHRMPTKVSDGLVLDKFGAGTPNSWPW